MPAFSVLRSLSSVLDMRPLRLDIQGLNSFRARQSIDFEPLLRDGLFGIFGPTGSGKSTVLDAITLALFGKVKRAPGGRGGIINSREESCHVAFTFEIGGGEERKRYTVERHLVRKDDGVRTKRARLVEHRADGSVPIAEKDVELEPRMREIIGIDLPEFLQAVVLPQGSFAEFLNLKPRERAAAMQRLFGLHDLGQRLNIRVRSLAAELKSDRAGLEGRLAELRLFDDETLARCRADLDVATNEHLAARALFDSATARHTSAAELHSLVAELRRLRDEEPERLERRVTVDAMHGRIERAERSRQMKHFIDEQEHWSARFQEAAARADDARRALGQAEELLARKNASRIQSMSAFDERHPFLQEQIVALRAIDKERIEIERLRDEIDGVRREEQRAIGERADLEVRRDRLAEEIDALRTRKQSIDVRIEELSDARRRIDELQELRLEAGELRRVEEQVDKANAELTELLAEAEEARQEHLELHDAERVLATQIARLNEEIESAEMRRVEIERAVTESKLHAGELEGALRLAESLESSRRDLETRRAELIDRRSAHEIEWKETSLLLARAVEMKGSVDAEREDLRARRDELRGSAALALMAEHLHDGSPCPLCGATEHPDPFDRNVDAEELERLERELEVAASRARTAEEEARHFGERMAGIDAHRAGSREEEARIATALVETESAMRATLANASNGVILLDLDALRSALARTKAAGTEREQELAATSATLAELESTYAAQQEERTSIARRLASAAERLASRNASIERMRDAIELLQKERSDRADVFAEHSGGRLPSQIEEELVATREREREAEAMVEERRALDREIDEARATLDAAERELIEQSHAVDALIGRRAQLEATVETKVEEMEARLAGIRVEGEEELEIEELIDLRDRQATELAEALERAREEHAEATISLEVRRSEAARNKEDAEKTERELERATASCRNALEEHRFASVDEALAAEMEREEIERVRSEAEEVERALRRASDRTIELDALIGDRSISEADVAVLAEEMAAAETALATLTERVGAARNDLERCQERNAEYHRVGQENQEMIRRTATVEQLSRYLAGDGFVNYLADERLADVCRRASGRLRDLTGGRLAIGSRPSDGFYIRDNGNGGIERAPTSLSGGETFLVSLSLALALSETIQIGRAPLEFFFLDEGFGTLDADLLDTVMTSLETLRSETRAIGVITHVSALRERVTQRLIIEPADDARGSMVRVEEA